MAGKEYRSSGDRGRGPLGSIQKGVAFNSLNFSRTLPQPNSHSRGNMRPWCPPRWVHFGRGWTRTKGVWFKWGLQNARCFGGRRLVLQRTQDGEGEFRKEVTPQFPGPCRRAFQELNEESQAGEKKLGRRSEPEPGEYTGESDAIF